MSDTAIALISVAGIICAIIFGYIAFMRAKRKDNTDEGQNKGVMLTEIGYIKAGVDDIKRKQDQLDAKQAAYLERLVCVEQSAKQAHHRIDEIHKKEGTL